MDPRLDEREEAMRAKAQQAASALAEAAATIDQDDATPRPLIAALGEAGMLGVSRAQAGAGDTLLDVALVCEELGAASAGAAANVVGHLMGTALVEAVGGEAQQPLLDALASGDKIAAVALDGAVSLLEEPAVSIAAACGAEVLELSGTARIVVGATSADVFVVPAVDADGVLSVSVVECGAAGVSIVASERKLGLNGSATGAVEFSGVSAPLPGDVGAVAALSAARDLARVGNAALCVGLGRAALEAATAYVAASDAGLDRSQSVQWMLADIATETEAARLLTWYACSRDDAAELREAAAMARAVAADAAVGASRRAVQILGPAGNRAASGVERLYRDAKAMEVHQGAAEAQRAVVARQLLPDLFDESPAG